MLPVLQYFNYAFNIIFTIEAIIKIIALKKMYFRDPWNKFDFFIVVSTQIVLILKFIDIFPGWSS